jgi:hypothetical protein
LFAFVQPYDGQDKPDYLMSGRLERLDEIDYGERVRVETKISAELVDLRNGTTVWAGNATSSTDVETSNMNAVVAAMSRALQMNIDQLVADMEKQLPGPQTASQPSSH